MILKRLRIAVILCIVAPVSIFPISSQAVTPIDNVEEKVNGEGPRLGAEQTSPDVSEEFAVWWDARGSASTVSGTSLWYKDLNTRTESRVVALSTRHSLPRISGSWVVWEDATPSGDNIDVYARQLPDGPIIRVTDDPAAQYLPAIDGTKVVWQDDRDFVTNGHDLYMKDLSDPEAPDIPVVTATGHQERPEISGDVVAWTDRRNGSSDPHVRAITSTSTPELIISDPSGTPTAFAPAVSGNRVVWSEGVSDFTCDDNGCTRDLELRTCELPCSVSSTVWESDDQDGQSEPDISGSIVVWREGGESLFRDISGPNPPEQLDPFPAECDSPIGEVHGSCGGRDSPRIDGNTTAWKRFPASGGSDIFWRDLSTGDPPTRASSLGMGFFPEQSRPAAGVTFTVFHADANSADASAFNNVWATDLRGDRRNFRVNTFDFVGEGGTANTAAGVGTAASKPRISGNRVAWSDLRNFAPTETGTDVFFRDLDPLGSESPVTSTIGIGNTPDIDGDRIVWLCSTTEMCLYQGGAITRFTLPVTPPLILDNLPVRISGSIVVWSQAELTGPCCNPVTSTIHALDLTSGENVLLGAGPSQPSYGGSTVLYDISGTEVVWVGLDGDIYRNTAAFPCAPSCDLSASATVFSDAVAFSSNGLSMDGTTVAWGESTTSTFTSDIWVQDLNESLPHQLTDNPSDQSDPYVFDDFVYWTDSRNEGFGTDIFRESISGGGATLTVDTAAPGPVTGLTAATGSTITVSWMNPADSDLAGVILMRKTGLSTATSVDDPNAALVFDGEATIFQDVDVADGVSYTYTAFPYDEVPNYGAGISVQVGGGIQEQASSPATTEEGGTVSTGEPTPSEPVAAEVTVPPESAGEDTTISITKFQEGDPSVPPDSSGFQFAGQVISVTTDPPTTFSSENPATLVLSYDQSAVPAEQDETTMEVLTSDGGEWSMVGEPCTGGVTGTALSPDPCIAARDTSANTITIKTTDFSFFGLGFPPAPPPPPPAGLGYWMVASDGGIFSFGNAGFHGSTGGIQLNRPIVGMAATKSGNGYWMVASDGGIFSFGDAGFHGSTGGIALNRPIVGMAVTKSGNGYWMVASDGGIFSFGDAGFHGSTGGIALNQPIVGMAVTASGNGYWMVASDGGIFSFGDAGFHGSTGGIALNRPIVSVAPTKSGNGYWMVASDGGIFSFGDAAFYGSTGGIALNRPIVGMAVTPSGNGYWMVASDGGIFSFGDAAFLGSTGGIALNRPVVGMAPTS